MATYLGLKLMQYTRSWYTKLSISFANTDTLFSKLLLHTILLAHYCEFILFCIFDKTLRFKFLSEPLFRTTCGGGGTFTTISVKGGASFSSPTTNDFPDDSDRATSMDPKEFTVCGTSSSCCSCCCSCCLRCLVRVKACCAMPHHAVTTSLRVETDLD